MSTNRSTTSTKRQYRVATPAGRKNQDKPFWARIGTGWENEPKEGKPATISVKLDALPVNGEIVLFVDDGDDGRNAGDEA